MAPIYLNGNGQGLNFETFYNKFIEICLDHKQQNRAILFAFILYDFTNEQIVKVLKDDDYWRSLDKLSGKYLTVFSLHYKNSTKRNTRPLKSSKFMRYMTAVDVDEDISMVSNSLLDEYFGEIDIKFPAILFFQIAEDKVLDYTIIQLSEEAIEPSFLEIKRYISKAIETLKKITDENKGNNQEIFSLVRDEVQGTKSKLTFMKQYKHVESFAKFIRLLIHPI